MTEYINQHERMLKEFQDKEDERQSKQHLLYENRFVEEGNKIKMIENQVDERIEKINQRNQEIEEQIKLI